MVEKYKIYSGTLFTLFWVLSCWGVVFRVFCPNNDFVRVIIFFTTDVTLLILGIWALRNKADIAMFLIFIVIAIISGYLNREGLVSTINGLRSYFPILTCLPIIRYCLSGKNASRFVASFDRQLLIFLYLQAIVLPIQFLVFGANDEGGGTFAIGGSGMVSTLIYIVSFYLLSKRWNFEKSWIRNFVENKKFFFLLFPSFLNETKVSFIYLVAFFILLNPWDRKLLWRSIAMLPVIGLLLWGLIMIYHSTTAGSQFDEIFTYENMSLYLTGGSERDKLIEQAIYFQDSGLIEVDASVFALDLPRFTKLFLVPDALDFAKGGWFFGAGVGQFKGGSVIGATPFARNFAWLLSGSVPSLFFILIELGLLGTFWTLLQLFRTLFPPSSAPMGKNIMLFVLLIWLVVMFYDRQLLVFVPTFITTYVAFNGHQPQYQESKERVVRKRMF